VVSRLADAVLKLTIVTPSYNQAAFLEATIQSVLQQQYPELDYIIMDGGSTDGSVDIIRAYAASLAHWESQPDRGQAHAINKGFEIASGQIVAYINSDDMYCPGAFDAVAQAFDAHPDAEWVCGPCYALDETKKTTSVMPVQVPADPATWLLRPSGQPYLFPQQGVFVRKRLVDEVGLFREDLHYSFDFEYFLRILWSKQRPVQLDTILATFRLHEASKTTRHESGFTRDDLAIADLYFERASPAHQRRLLQQRHEFKSWRILNQCSATAQTVSPRAARRALWQEVLQDPRLLRYRAVLGAFRRWYGLGPAS
jgi:glycosyltransferase involved in cell wall biosynthesis